MIGNVNVVARISYEYHGSAKQTDIRKAIVSAVLAALKGEEQIGFTYPTEDTQENLSIHIESVGSAGAGTYMQGGTEEES